MFVITENIMKRPVQVITSEYTGDFKVWLHHLFSNVQLHQFFNILQADNLQAK
jgi:hypothetical protein